MSGLGRWAPQPGTVVSAVLVSVAFTTPGWPPLACVGMVPWLWSLRSSGGVARAVGQGLWLGILLGFGGAFWVAYAVPRYLEVSRAAGIAALALHSLTHQLQLPVFAGVYWARRRAAPPARFLDVVLLAALYTGLDWASPKLLGDTLGLALHGSTALRQLAAFGGEWTLTWLVVAINLATYALLDDALARRAGAGRPLRAALRRVVWLVGPVVILYGVGTWELGRVRRAIADPDRTVRVGVVQGSVPEAVRRRWADGDPTAALEALKTYVGETRSLLERPDPPDLVVWPETSYPGVFRKPESDAQLRLNVAFDRTLAEWRVPIVFGAYDRSDRRDRRVLRNALYFVEPLPEPRDRELPPMQVYHKGILFPIGEYVPLLGEDQVRPWLPGAAHLEPGGTPRPYEITVGGGAPLRIGPTICYEDMFADHVAGLARDGADLLVNVSNDDWFGDYGAARLHLVVASLRSVETRLPQVRATNSGYSAIILPDGEIAARIPFGETGALAGRLPIVDLAPTVRTRVGEWFAPTCLVLGIVGMAATRAPERGAAVTS